MIDPNDSADSLNTLRMDIIFLSVSKPALDIMFYNIALYRLPRIILSPMGKQNTLLPKLVTLMAVTENLL